VTYRLADGTELARHEAPGEGRHLLGDLTVTPDGTVLVSDALAGTVLRLRPGRPTLETLVPPNTFVSPQTPGLAADGKTLLVPDWTLGLLALPLAGGTPEPVRGPDDLVTGGIDGLVGVEGGVLAVQNGIVVPRLVRLWLDPAGARITRWTVLAQSGSSRSDARRRRAWRGAGHRRQRVGPLHRGRRREAERTSAPVPHPPPGSSLSKLAK
jgi:hypothetical protein